MRSPGRSFSILIFLVALLLGGSLARPAGASPTGKETYGIAPDGTDLHWIVYKPGGPGPWPAVLVIHGGGFKSGGPGSGAECAADLAAAGYLAYAIEYRLAPDGSLPGQVSDGRFPQQTDDVKMAVRAARADPRCNGQVGAVGGSAGGYDTAYVAATGTPGDDRIEVGVSLSGAYDFSDFSPDPNINTFTHDVTNYVGTSAADTAALRAASPAWLVDARVAPLFLINSAQDPMPFPQLADMTGKLDSLGVINYRSLTLPGSAHAFDYWSVVKEPAIAFLAAGFAGEAGPPPAPTPTADAPAHLANVSTRVHVGSGDQVMIGGFIIAGAERKRVVLRALGPSLAQAGLSDTLADPVLELYDASGRLVGRNDNWTSIRPDVSALGLAPESPNESVITAALPAGNYTAVLSGAGGTSGVALLELYDLDPATSTVTNISTRGAVRSNDDPLIGGFILDGDQPTKVLVRAIGPSLRDFAVNDAMSDPVLELRNADGSLLFANDNWPSDQASAIRKTGTPPSDNRESAIVATLAPGSYTAVVRDAAGQGGVALVEVYALPND